MELYYPEGLLLNILESKPNFSDVDEEEKSQRLVESLSEEDRELAASTSFAYWYASRGALGDCLITPIIRNNMAMKEARRHLVGGGGNVDAALKSLKASIEFRKEFEINTLRICFVTNVPNITHRERQQCGKFEALIKSELPKQHLLVRGRDIENRPIVLYMSRQEDTSTTNFDTEAFLITRMYAVERAIATAEFLSAGREEKLTVAFRMDDYVRANAPPLTAIQTVVSRLQRNYPERLERFLLLDPPFWMRSLYTLLRPFLDSKTASKFILVTGDVERNRVVSQCVDSDQAMPFMRSDGKLITPVDPMYYLDYVPFFCPYDETCLSTESGLLQTAQ